MMAGWSASAVAGGFLLDHHGFGFTFIITAVLQARAATTTTTRASPTLERLHMVVCPSYTCQRIASLWYPPACSIMLATDGHHDCSGAGVSWRHQVASDGTAVLRSS